MSTVRDEGFTLVELLIAMALLGLLTLLAYGTVQFGDLSWRRASSRRSVDAEAAAITHLLAQSIRGSYPGFASNDYADRTVTFWGAPESLELIAPLPQALTEGLMAIEHFGLAPGHTRSSLRMSWHLDLPTASGGNLPAKAVDLSTSVAKVRFSYFGRVNESDPPAWFDSWAGLSRLPELVRVRIWRIEEPNQTWLDFSAAPETTVNTACIYDPVAPVCRRVE